MNFVQKALAVVGDFLSKKGYGVDLSTIVEAMSDGFRTGKKTSKRTLIVSPKMLRNLSKTDPIIRAIINTRKSQISQADWDVFNDTEAVVNELNKWKSITLNNLEEHGFKETYEPDLLPSDYYDIMEIELENLIENNISDLEKLKDLIDKYFEAAIRSVNNEADKYVNVAKKLLSNPSRNGTERTFRDLINKVVEDILVGDCGNIIKNKSIDGKSIAELYTVDGFTLEPSLTDKGEYDEEYAFIQKLDTYMDNKRVVNPKFKLDEVIYIMENPMPGSVYGFSALEAAVFTITVSLMAEQFNSSYFDNTNIPDGIIDLGKNVNDEQRKRFKVAWNNELKGRPHKLAFVSGSEGVKWVPFKAQTPRDMQFINYLNWTLKVKAACFKINENEIGWTDTVNRSVGEVQSNLSYDNGAISLMKLLSEKITTELLKSSIHEWIKFEFIATRKINDLTTARTSDKLDVESGIMSINAYQQKYGLPVTSGGEKPLMAIGTGSKVPLEDVVKYSVALLEASGASPSTSEEEEYIQSDDNQEEAVEEKPAISEKEESETAKNINIEFKKLEIKSAVAKKKITRLTKDHNKKLMTVFDKNKNKIIKDIKRIVGAKK